MPWKCVQLKQFGSLDGDVVRCGEKWAADSTYKFWRAIAVSTNDGIAGGNPGNGYRKEGRTTGNGGRINAAGEEVVPEGRLAGFREAVGAGCE